MNQSTKSAPVAYLLWFFLGGFGAHRFYMGRTGSALGMMGLCIASMVLSVFVIGLIGFPILFAWWVIDAFQLNKWLQHCPAGDAVAGSMSEPPAQEQEPAHEQAQEQEAA
ncbi:MAG: TM2 domain-containing protein [Planctomycetota bacterium]|jgi:TM2 domain-containing membrane protein YozV